MERRRFVGLASAGLAIVATPFVYRYFSPVAFEPGWASPGSLAMIMEPDTIRTLGEVYLKTHEDEASHRVLSSHFTTLSDEVRREEAIKADFQARRTVVVDGWLLSVTEARQCALASLQPKS